MATCNFMSANCTRFFAIGMNRYYTKEDVEECDLDPQLEGEFDEFGTETDYEDSKQNIVSGLQEKGWEDYDGYEGACMDLSGKVTIVSAGDYWTGSPEYDMFDDGEFSEVSVVDDNWTGNAGLNHLQAKNIIKKLNAIIEDLRNEAEYVFSCNCGEELSVAYHCSNGETGYSRIEKRLYQEVDETKPTKAA